MEEGNGRINVSLDSATPEIYKNVKGVDGFKKVKENLGKYAAKGSNNIELKYIVFTKNNQFKEILGFLNIAKELGIENLEFSLNFQEINNNTITEKTLIAAAFLYTRAIEMGFASITPFFVDDIWRNKIEKIISSGKFN